MRHLMWTSCPRIWWVIFDLRMSLGLISISVIELTSVGGVFTEFRLSDIDAMVGQNNLSGRAGPSRIPVGFAGVEIRLYKNWLPTKSFRSDEVIIRTNLQKLYWRIFELNPAMLLDPGHTTTSLIADQLIQFAREVGLEVNLASFGLLEVLQLHPRSAGNLAVRGQPWLFGSP